MRRIDSRNNPLIVRTAKLSSRKERETTGLFFFEGVHLLEEYLRFGFVPETVFVREDVFGQYQELLRKIPEEALCTVPAPVFEKLSTEQAPQGILTVSKKLPGILTVSEGNQLPGRILLLESVRDNGNVGTVIRTATALGWHCVVTADCADLYSPKTVRATMGTMFSGSVSVTEDAIALIRSLRASGRKTYATTLGKENRFLGTFPIGKDDCFVVGNEGQGISEELASACDAAVIIPMTPYAESLNASVAAAVVMWEGSRQTTEETKKEIL